MNESPAKVLLVANTSWYLYNFRRPLARRLSESGFSPVFVSPADRYSERLKEEGFRWIEYSFDRRGMNPLRELAAVVRLFRIYRREKPAVVHHFTIKCMIYGTWTARLCGIRAIINAVTGLGHAFVDSGVKARVLRPWVRLLYRFSFSADHVHMIFQNEDDQKAFQRMGVLDSGRTTLIRSSGVDEERFSPRKPAISELPVVLFIGRLIREKGITEFVESARLLKLRGLGAVFRAVGELDPGNPSSVSGEEYVAWREAGTVDFVGHVEDVENQIAEASVVVLPSYREGVPRSLLEAAAMEKPLVATDVPGCREIVENGVNGLLVSVRDPAALASAVESLVRDPARREKMGRAGRQKVLDEFTESRVLQATVEVYRRHPGLPGSKVS